MRRFFSVLGSIATLSLVALSSAPAHAQLNIAYSVDGAGPFPFGPINGNIAGFNGAALLIENVPQILPFGSQSLARGGGGVIPFGTQFFNANRSMIINGLSLGHIQDYSITSAPDLSSSVSGGVTTTFELGDAFVDVTPIANTTPTLGFFDSSVSSDIFATFVYRSGSVGSAAAPEPGTLALLGVGLRMVGFVTRRRK